MNKGKVGKIIGKTILIFLVFCAVLIQIYPLFWIFTSSMKTSAEFSENPAYALPSSFYFENYRSVIFESNIPRYFLNSTIVAFATLILLSFLGSLAGFAISKMHFKGKNAIFLYLMAGMMVPIFVGLIPIFQMYNALGLRDTYLSLILPQVGFAIPISMFLYMGFMDFIPNELQESAFIDGATAVRVYAQIMMPMCMNATITVLTFNFISVWNEYTFANTFISAGHMRTLPIGLTEFLSGLGMRNWGLTFAAIGISILPTLVVYFFLNDRVIDGMAAGAIKG
jgi:raffinose/stachyose/melibiose transport system permease protein